MKRSVYERFVEKVKIDHATGCWVWTASRDPAGYGRLGINGKSARAFKWAYTHFVGEVPDGLILDHLCRNRACVNPRHLEPVTFRENILRGTGASAQNARKTHCPHGHRLEPNPYRPGWRCCPRCEAQARARWQKKHRAKMRAA